MTLTQELTGKYNIKIYKPTSHYDNPRIEFAQGIATMQFTMAKNAMQYLREEFEKYEFEQTYEEMKAEMEDVINEKQDEIDKLRRDIVSLILTGHIEGEADVD